MKPVLYKINTQRAYFFDDDKELQELIYNFKNDQNEFFIRLCLTGDKLKKYSLRRRDKNSADDICNYSKIPYISLERKNEILLGCNHYFLFFDKTDDAIEIFRQILRHPPERATDPICSELN
jgi:hypothetical protein